MKITILTLFPEMFDSFLNTESDYLQLDYLFNAIHKDNNCNEYHYFKSYSLCQMLLEKRKETELDWKLPEFIDNTISMKKRKEIA